jgi:hypothetical protein
MVLMYGTCYSCQILVTLEFWTDFREDSNIKFHENPFSGSHTDPCGRMDGQT